MLCDLLERTGTLFHLVTSVLLGIIHFSVLTILYNFFKVSLGPLLDLLCLCESCYYFSLFLSFPHITLVLFTPI